MIVTATVPLEVTVIDFETAVPTETLPNASEVALRVSAGVAAFSCNATLFDELFDVAVTVAVCVVLTALALALKAALDAPAATVTLAGTVSALVLLASATLCPPV